MTTTRPAPSLADVIRRALIGDRVGTVHPNQFHHSGVIDADQLAAAVAAHLASDAVIERMARAMQAEFGDISDMWNDFLKSYREEWCKAMRAAVAAVVGEVGNG